MIVFNQLSLRRILVPISTTIMGRELTFRSTRTLRCRGRCSQSEESSPSHRSADFTTDTNDEPLERGTLLNIWSHPRAIHRLFSQNPVFQSASDVHRETTESSLLRIGFGPLPSNRPNGGSFLCSMEFLVGTSVSIAVRDPHSIGTNFLARLDG